MMIAEDSGEAELGYWVNRAPQHRSVRLLLISEHDGKFLINPFGAVSPATMGRECDWGITEG